MLLEQSNQRCSRDVADDVARVTLKTWPIRQEVEAEIERVLALAVVTRRVILCSPRNKPQRSAAAQ
jgi:hypothetical protein